MSHQSSGAGLFLAAVPPNVLQTVSTNLAVNVSTGAQPPVYTPLISASITTLMASSYLEIRFYCTARLTGPSVANQAPNVRFTDNGVLLPISRGVTVNMIPSRIMPMSFLRRIVVSAGVHLIEAEWAYFGIAGLTLRCNPVTLPDLEGAQLVLQEQTS